MGKSTLCIECFDFDSGKKIENGRAEIKNVDNKNVEIRTIVNGKVTLNIDKENIADFYNIVLINDDGSKQSPYFLAKTRKEINGEMVLVDSLQKLINARSYEKCNAKLYFKQCESPTNQYKVGIIKCYKEPNDDESVDKKRQEAYHYYNDSKDEIFVADCTQMIALQAYFYNDLETDKLLSQKKREILSNESMQSCVNIDEVQWSIKAGNKKYTFKGNPIFVNLKDFGFKNSDILTIKAKLKSQKNDYIAKRKMPYKEPFKADGKLFIGNPHNVIDALGEMRLAIEDRYALVYDYRGLFLYANRHEVCQLDIRDTKIKNLNDYIDFKKKYEAEIVGKTPSTISIRIKVNANQKIALTFDCNNSNALSFFNHKQIGSTIHFIYYEPTQYVIVINRHTQTPKYTLSNYQILEQKNGKYTPLRNEIEKIASGVILEPCGPDGLLADTILRIPQGHYKIKQHPTQAGLREYMTDNNNKNPQQELPKLYDDEFVLSGSAKNKERTEILIHAGTNVLELPLDRTEGCLLIGKKFKNGELMTHSDYKINLAEVEEKLTKAIQEKNTKISNIQHKRLKPDEEKSEIDKIKLDFENKDGKHYKNNIEPYINASIRILMEFINKNAIIIKSKDNKNTYKNFSIYIKNNFSKGEDDVRMG